LFECASCGREIKAEDQFFSSSQGGVLCPACGGGQAGARRVSLQALKYLRHFQRTSYAEAQRAQPALEVRAEVESLLQYYLTYLLERALNSPGFIAQVKI
jgi:DNA repair protein RecO (recombination protein O)